MKKLISYLEELDLPIVVTVLFIVFWGVLNMYSATIHEYKYLYIKQLVYAIFGIFMAFWISSLDYRKIVNMSFYFYLIGTVSLIIVLVAGTTILGAKRWISFGPITVQPSEIMKFIVIITTAKLLGQAHEGGRLIDALKVLFVVSIPATLILLQPDLGTAIMVTLPALIAIYLSGIKKKYIITAILIFLAISPFIWSHLKDYQKNRILAFLMPEKDPFNTAYHLIQSQIAIGSGKIFGKGYLQGTQSKLFFLPEQHTDFIFATIGEEWGFVVSFLLLSLYLFIGIRIISWGNKISDLAGKYICYMSGSLVSIQAFINIAMTVGFAPVVGITLPMISYGGTSLITFLLIIGLTLSVIREHKHTVRLRKPKF